MVVARWPGMNQHDTLARPSPSERTRTDLRSVAISGVTTFAWYAVPDVVQPRWARALAKTAVLGASVALVMGGTREGAEARAAVREVQDGIRSAAEQPSATEQAPLDEDGAAGAAPGGTGSGRAVVATAAVVGGVAVAGTLAVLGERWIYRSAERLRGRGVRAPHTAVGLVLGAAVAGLDALEGPFSAARPR
jgi:hypothetical protein